MNNLITQKLIFSGNFLEVYDYADGYLRGFKRKPREDTERQKQSLMRKHFSLNRARQNIRRIVNANPNLKKFLTLTFRENVKDLDVAHYEFKKFLYRIKARKDNFSYIAVVEFQERGAVHYHIICNLQYMRSKEIEKIWGNGFIKINRISNIENVGAYVAKYLDKDICDPRLNGRKAYFTSKEINRPSVIVDNSLAKKIKRLYNLDNQDPEKEFEFENEYCGKVKYRIFKLDKCKV